MESTPLCREWTALDSLSWHRLEVTTMSAVTERKRLGWGVPERRPKGRKEDTACPSWAGCLLGTWVALEDGNHNSHCEQLHHVLCFKDEDAEGHCP